MGLGRKNLVYSFILAGMLMLFLLGYFIYMLPSLYVDAMMEQNLKSVREQHNSYVENGTYEGVAVRNSAACFSVEFPFAENKVLVAGKSFSAEVIVRDVRLYQVLERCKEKWRAESDFRDADLHEEIEEISSVFREAIQDNLSLPVEVRLLHQWSGEEFYNESMKVHVYSNDMFILEASVEDSANRYTNYIAVQQGEDSLIFTYLPVVSPDMNEIRPVVLRSLPMLGAVILLMVLLFSQVYSKGIVSPVVGLVRRAGEMKYALGAMEGFSGGGTGSRKDSQGSNPERCRVDSQGSNPERCRVDSQGNNLVGCNVYSQWEDSEKSRKKYGRRERDEIRELAATLEDFYRQIKENLCSLEEKNNELADENKRQEIFLRASSHQLKTPIAAALLLVEGMINEIGRYKDTKMYLPKVKVQLLSMRKIVEDILYLNHCTENIHLQQIEPERLLREKLHAYQVQIAEKEILVEFAGDENLKICTDEMVFSQILDNLLSNGVKYTPPGGLLRISVNQMEQEPENMEIRIENSGVTIPEELLPHIFEPFISGTNGTGDLGTDRHGLGLYIAAYYARKLGVSLTIRNGKDCVVASVLTRD